MVYKANTKVRASTDYIAVHCSATGPKQNIGAADIDKWHRAKGWKCIGYHYVIKRDGTVEEGRDDSTIGAHVENWNSVSVGICMVGGVDANDIKKAVNNFTPEQFDSLKTLLQKLKVKYPKAKIQGHRDFPKVAKACPSFDVAEWLMVAQLDN
jgi:N-acetylmuramoyl-L-alanine amidase